MSGTVSVRVVSVAIAAVVATGSAFAQVRAELVASGFTQPVAFVQDPSDATVQVVVQQDGRIRVLKGGLVQPADYLDLRAVVRNAGEQGLLGLAFAPDYGTSGRVFVNFVNLDGDTVIARFTRSPTDPLRANPQSRFDFRWPDGSRVISQPFANHNGGNLVFGPDGFLYAGMGDGGSGDDPMHFAQNPQSLLGKMLRLDVAVPDADPEGYNVPPTNPFVAQPAVRGEIWSLGLRNPWRWSFDDPARGGTGAMVIADVGQNAFEEIDYEPAGRGGRNYGWRNREGAHSNVTSLPPFSQPLVDPIFEYSHTSGRSITGGHVYRGSLLGVSARGRYFFGDFITNRVWSIRLTISPVTGEATASDLTEHTDDLRAAAASPASFGVDASGELYVVNYAGTVYRLFSDNPAPGPPEPSPTPTPGPVFGRQRPPDAPITGRAVPRAAPAPAASPDVTIVTTTGGPGVVSADWPFAMAHRNAWASLAVAQLDIDVDGRADLVWRRTAGGVVTIWIWFVRPRSP